VSGEVTSRRVGSRAPAFDRECRTLIHGPAHASASMGDTSAGRRATTEFARRVTRPLSGSFFAGCGACTTQATQAPRAGLVGRNEENNCLVSVHDTRSRTSVKNTTHRASIQKPRRLSSLSSGLRDALVRAANLGTTLTGAASLAGRG